MGKSRELRCDQYNSLCPDGDSDEDESRNFLDAVDDEQNAIYDELERTIAEANLETLKGMGIKLHHEETLARAAQSGALIQFLKKMCMPLAHFPLIANGHFDEARHELLHCNGLDAVYLISNYLLVPHLPSELMLEDIIQEMVVFKPPRGKAVTKAPGLGGFPHELKGFYLKRMFHWSPHEMSFLADRRVLQIRDRMCCGGTLLEFNTFDPSRMEFDRASKKGLQIPAHAEYVAYVRPMASKGYFVGAFLYLGPQLQPLTVLWLTNEPQSIALCFYKGAPMNSQSAQYLKEAGRWLPITLPQLRDAGARFYAFVHAHETLGHTTCGDDLGGFAYHVEDPEGRPHWIFFAIEAAGEIVERGSYLHGQDMSATELAYIPSPKEIVCRVTEAEKTFITSTDVRLGRLEVSGIVHPVMLRSLAKTPRQEVLGTRAAKAIASAAYSKHSYMRKMSAMAEVISLFSVLWFTSVMRHDSRDRTPQSTASLHWSFAGMIFFVIVCLSLCLKICAEALYWYGLRKWGWLKSYLSRVAGNCFFEIIRLSLESSLVAQLFAYRGNLPNTPHSRLLCAFVGLFMWLELLWSCRTVESASLGRRVLPILEAFDEAFSFLILTAFIFGASMHVSYSLTGLRIGRIFFDTYRMGFTGDMDAELFLDSDDMSFTFYGIVELLCYCFFGFLVMVSLSNIFIQVMGNAYHNAGKNVGISFVRHRAQTSLRFMLIVQSFWDLLFCGACNEDETDNHVWLCWPHWKES